MRNEKVFTTFVKVIRKGDRIMKRKGLLVGLCLLCMSFLAMGQKRADRQQLTDENRFQ